jgi:hypothetical protein
MKHIKTVLRRKEERWEGNGESEFGQSTLDAYMEMSQWNPSLQLIYDSKNKICFL